MTALLFTEWANQLNNKFRLTGRKVLLLMDNCSAHPHDLQLSNIKFLLLPPNTTSRSQPMDAGVIANFKQLYRLVDSKRNLSLDCVLVCVYVCVCM